VPVNRREEDSRREKAEKRKKSVACNACTNGCVHSNVNYPESNRLRGPGDDLQQTARCLLTFATRATTMTDTRTRIDSVRRAASSFLSSSCLGRASAPRSLPRCLCPMLFALTSVNVDEPDLRPVACRVRARVAESLLAATSALGRRLLCY